jgi:hypothetical protein
MNFPDQVALVYSQRGHRVLNQISRSDSITDLVIQSAKGKKWIVRCYECVEVSVDAVNDTLQLLQSEQAQQVAVISTGRITADAREAAAGKPISLVDNRKFQEYWRQIQVQSSSAENEIKKASSLSKPREEDRYDPTYSPQQRKRIGCLLGLIAVALIAYFVINQQTQPPLSNPSIEAPGNNQWSKVAGRLWKGVKIYYGMGESKAYGFEILGGNEHCPSILSGRGLKVLYPDGHTEWKDRDAILFSDVFFVKEDDPAADKGDWEVYDDC